MSDDLLRRADAALDDGVRDGDSRPIDALRSLTVEVGYLRRAESDDVRFVWVGNAVTEVLGLDPAEVLSDPAAWDDRIAADDRSTVRDATIDTAAPTVLRYRWHRSPTEVVTVEERAVGHRDHDGTRLRVGSLRSIEDLVRAESRIEGERERLDLVLEGISLGLWDWSFDDDHITVNKRWAAILGYTQGEIEPVDVARWRSLIHPDDLAESDELVERHFNGESAFFDVECRMKHRRGHWVWVHDRGKVVEWDTGGRPIRMTGTREDITRRRESENALRDQVLVDPLTKLGNRRMLEARMDDLVSEARFEGTGFGVIALDIDGFKDVNDSLGHLRGDECLRAVAACIAAAVRPTDLAIRPAGDEFCVLLPDTDAAAVPLVAERLLAAIRAAAIPGAQGDPPLSVSIGSAHSGEPGHLDEESVLALADERLYAAKRSGRDRAVCA